MATFKVGYVKGKYQKDKYVGLWGAGYYWPHINDTGFDWFLRYMLNCKRERFTSRSALKKGQIIIGNSSGHTYVIVDNNQRIFEANDAWRDSICYGREYVNYDPYYVYTLPWTEDEVDAFLYNLKQIADDNNYYYSHNNSLGNYNYYNAFGLDCCTSISLALYITLGWKWNNQTYQNANYQYIYIPAKEEKPNGLQDKPEADGRWAYYTNGKVDTSVTTVAQNKNGWWYVKNGYVDFTYNGLALNKYGTWVIKAGEVDFSAKGFWEGTINLKYGFWWCEGGQVQFDKCDIIEDPYDGNWKYVKNGLFTEFNGISSNEHGVWRVCKGVVDFTDGTYTEKVTVKGGMVCITPSQQ